MYGINRRYQNKTFWLCSNYTKTKCTARMTTSGKTATLSNGHNHAPVENRKQLDNARFTIVTIFEKRKDVDNLIDKLQTK